MQPYREGDKLLGNQILGDQVDASQDNGNHPEMADGFPFDHGEQESREPGKHGTEVGNHVQQTGSDSSEDWVVKAQDQKENADQGDHHQRDHGHANQVVAQDIAQVYESLLQLIEPAHGKQLQR